MNKCQLPDLDELPHNAGWGGGGGVGVVAMVVVGGGRISMLLKLTAGQQFILSLD